MERTVTFTMEDALISPEGFMILSGAGLIEASGSAPIYQHMTETVDKNNTVVSTNGDTLTITLSQKPYLPVDKDDNFAYVMLVKDGEIISEPFIPEHEDDENPVEEVTDPITNVTTYKIVVKNHDNYITQTDGEEDHAEYTVDSFKDVKFDSVIVDYYVERTAGARQIEITPDKFGGNYYLEASTLFRDQNGVDMPAEFIIPNCKIQSNFNFTMASTGDPSTFTFTMDAFPDYTRFDHSKKVLAAIQIIEDAGSMDLHRHSTAHEGAHDKYFV